MHIVIPGRPIPAVRMTQRTLWKKSAKRYLAYKDMIGTIAQQHCREPSIENVSARVTVYLSGVTTPMGNDGDIDNYLKSALDGLNKIAYVDDRQVTWATVTKKPCSKEDQRMEIEIV